METKISRDVPRSERRVLKCKFAFQAKNIALRLSQNNPKYVFGNTSQIKKGIKRDLKKQVKFIKHKKINNLFLVVSPQDFIPTSQTFITKWENDSSFVKYSKDE